MNKFFIKFLLVFVAFAVVAGCRQSSGTTTNGSNAQTSKVAPERVVVDGMRTSYADLVQKTSPAVVRIKSMIKAAEPTKSTGNPFDDFFKQLPEQQDSQPHAGLGSGVLVSQDGTILTNNHVVADAETITVELENNETYDAKVIGTDPPSDLAVLKIEGKNFPFLSLGDSDKVLVGDIVLAIGNPLGLGQTVTSGIISAKGRRTGLGDGSFEDFLQTDAAINRGNSGGALINLQGELIGINSQILSPTGGSIGIGFSIPSNMAKSIMQQLLKDRKVRRGMLGVSIQNLNEEIAKQFGIEGTKGALVSNVQPNSAADKAGIKRGDIITGFNGEAIEDGNSLRNKVAATAPGTSVTLTIMRDGKSTDVKATLDELTTSDTEKPENSQGGESSKPAGEAGKLGLNLTPLTPEIADELKLPSGTKGLVVSAVDSNGPAAAEGIMRGDVIVEINRQPVSTLEDARAALEKAGNNSSLLLIQRQGQTVYLSVKPGK
ncbi:MAG: DegQ family serine endoprotease [Pyrinomonadaceae bacterium]